MSDLTLIEPQRAQADHPLAFTRINETMQEAATAYGGSLVTVAWFLYRTGNAVTLRALAADVAEFLAWLHSDRTSQPFSLFLEERTALH